MNAASLNNIFENFGELSVDYFTIVDQNLPSRMREKGIEKVFLNYFLNLGNKYECNQIFFYLRLMKFWVIILSLKRTKST